MFVLVHRRPVMSSVRRHLARVGFGSRDITVGMADVMFGSLAPTLRRLVRVVIGSLATGRIVPEATSGLRVIGANAGLDLLTASNGGFLRVTTNAKSSPFAFPGLLTFNYSS